MVSVLNVIVLVSMIFFIATCTSNNAVIVVIVVESWAVLPLLRRRRPPPPPPQRRPAITVSRCHGDSSRLVGALAKPSSSSHFSSGTRSSVSSSSILHEKTSKKRITTTTTKTTTMTFQSQPRTNFGVLLHMAMFHQTEGYEEEEWDGYGGDEDNNRDDDYDEDDDDGDFVIVEEEEQSTTAVGPRRPPPPSPAPSRPLSSSSIQTPEINFSDDDDNRRKIPPRRRARPPLPSPTRKKGVDVSATDTARLPAKATKNDKNQNQETTMMNLPVDHDDDSGCDRHVRTQHNERLDYLALTVEEILSSSSNANRKNSDKYKEGDYDDDGIGMSEGKNKKEGISRRDALLQKFAAELADDDDDEGDFDNTFSSEGLGSSGGGSSSSSIRSEDDETVALLRKAKNENRYEIAAEIIEKIQNQQLQQQQQQQQKKKSQVDSSSRSEARLQEFNDNDEDTYNFTDIDDDDDGINPSNEFQSQRRRRRSRSRRPPPQEEEQFDQDILNLRDSLPSLEEENEEIIQLLARARRDGSMATSLVDEDDDNGDAAADTDDYNYRLDIQSRRKNSQDDDGDDGGEKRRQNQNKKSPKSVDRNIYDSSSSSSPTPQLITDYEWSGDGSVFLSPDAYKQACEGNGSTMNPDGSLNFATFGDDDNRKSTKQWDRRRRRNVQVSPETISSEMDGPMAPYEDTTSEEETQKMINIERSGDYGEGDDVTLEDVMETYRNLDRSLVDVVVGWKDPSQLKTAASDNATSPTPEQEEYFRQLLSEADEIEDRAFQERQAADPQDLYRKLYEYEINELDRMLDEIHNELGLDDSLMDSSSRKEGGRPEGKDSTIIGADIVDGNGEDIDGIFYSDTPAGKELEEMIEKSRNDHRNFVTRYYSTKQKSEEEWDNFKDSEDDEATEE